MIRLFIIFIFAFILHCSNINAQDSDNIDCSTTIPDARTENNVKRYLSKQYTLVSLKIKIIDCYKTDSVFNLWIQNEQIDSANMISKQVLDSIVIRLSNTLYWNISEDLPVKPSGFYFKILTKKGRNKPDMIDYLKYLQFCSNFDDSNDNPCIFKERYTIYTTILVNDKAALNLEYDYEIYNKVANEMFCRQIIR